MKKIVVSLTFLICLSTFFAQLQTPKASPKAKMEQRVGLTDITIEYSRPSKNNRTIFGDVVPFDEVWRTGANENTKLTTSDALIFGKDTLKAGTYAIFTKPSKESWELYFYSDVNNWGTPEKWEDSKVVLKISSPVSVLTKTKETFSIALEDLSTKSASLHFSWDKTSVSFPFSLLTDQKTLANIKKVMDGPSPGDYYNAANYYYTNKIDLKQALEWVDKAIASNPNAFWMLRTKATIQKELGDKKGAIQTAKLALVAAEKANNKNYVSALTSLIADWSK